MLLSDWTTISCATIWRILRPSSCWRAVNLVLIAMTQSQRNGRSLRSCSALFSKGMWTNGKYCNLNVRKWLRHSSDSCKERSLMPGEHIESVIAGVLALFWSPSGQFKGDSPSELGVRSFFWLMPSFEEASVEFMTCEGATSVWPPAFIRDTRLSIFSSNRLVWEVAASCFVIPCRRTVFAGVHSLFVLWHLARVVLMVATMIWEFSLPLTRPARGANDAFALGLGAVGARIAVCSWLAGQRRRFRVHAKKEQFPFKSHVERLYTVSLP